MTNTCQAQPSSWLPWPRSCPPRSSPTSKIHTQPSLRRPAPSPPVSRSTMSSPLWAVNLYCNETRETPETLPVFTLEPPHFLLPPACKSSSVCEARNNVRRPAPTFRMASFLAPLAASATRTSSTRRPLPHSPTRPQRTKMRKFADADTSGTATCFALLQQQPHAQFPHTTTVSQISDQLHMCSLEAEPEQPGGAHTRHLGLGVCR